MGTRFGTGFDASRVMLTSWGTLDVNFNGCDRGTLAYASLDSTFGSGTLAPSRLTTLASAACHAAKPSVPAGGTWSAGATMAILESETGLATVGTRSCTMGGYTSQRTFQCYDASSNSWTVMPPMPAGRDHGEAVAHDGSIYFTGGLGETGDSWGWRFDFPSNRWVAVPELPNVAASGAALLNGFAYFAGFSAIYQFNPRTRQVRLIAADNRAARDHSQLVAFQGELWFMGGRNGLGVVNRVVSIFDPASETWRAGPCSAPRARDSQRRRRRRRFSWPAERTSAASRHSPSAAPRRFPRGTPVDAAADAAAGRCTASAVSSTATRS
jgi:hypothetical protein